MHRRTLLALVSTAGLAAPLATRAAPARVAFTSEKFREAQAAGQSILVHVEASWCPTCAKQRPIIARLLDAPEFAKLVLLDVDFDAQKDVVRGFGVQMQSTLIAFRGVTETARSVGETQETGIRALMEKTIA